MASCDISMRLSAQTKSGLVTEETPTPRFPLRLYIFHHEENNLDGEPTVGHFHPPVGLNLLLLVISAYYRVLVERTVRERHLVDVILCL